MTTSAESRPASRVAAASRNSVINLRLPAATRDLIDSAAAVAGKTRTEFVLDSAKQQAVDVLLDQRLFSLDEGQFDAFLRVLDEPPEPPRKLVELFNRKTPWEL